jgi:hypothetical protein
MTISNGKLMALSLGAVKTGYTEAGKTIWLVDIQGNYWWNGQVYPYQNKPSPVTAGQTTSVTFYDNPGVYVIQCEGEMYSIPLYWCLKDILCVPRQLSGCSASDSRLSLLLASTV